MSSRKRWDKNINIKHSFKRDKFFKSYWIRKTFNKITMHSDLFTCERVFFKAFLSWKYYYLTNLLKNKRKFFNRNLNFNKTKLSNIYFFYSFRTSYFRKILYARIFSNFLKKKNNKNVSKKIKLKSKDFIFFNNKKFYFKSKKKVFKCKRKSLIPVLNFPKFLKSIKWQVTVQSKRFGKYWHNIPTPISFPRFYNFGLRIFGDHLKYSKKNFSFSERLNKEYLGILLESDQTYFFKTYYQAYLSIQTNGPYAGFRWK